MNATPPNVQRIHPLVATAAVAVTIFSLAGIAAIAGWLPTGKATPGETPVAASTSAVPAQAAAQPPAEPRTVLAESPVAPKPVEQSTPKPVVKTPSKPAAAKPASAEVTQAPAVPVSAPPAPPVCHNCGVVDNIREIAQPGEGTGLGAVAGGVVGAILGHQIGGGTGKQIATVAGAAGGAYAGHQIEKSQRKTKHYEVIVRMNDGSFRSVMMDMVPGWQVGERVRVENNTLVRDN